MVTVRYNYPNTLQVAVFVAVVVMLLVWRLRLFDYDEDALQSAQSFTPSEVRPEDSYPGREWY